MKLTLEDDGHCFVCGQMNPAGLHLRFLHRDGKVFSEFIPQKIHQGYRDIVHGGIISAILDEAMVKVALMHGMHAVTAEMTVRFKNPLLTGEKAIIEATVLKSNRKIIEAAAVMRNRDETIIADGTAKLLKQD